MKSPCTNIQASPDPVEDRGVGTQVDQDIAVGGAGQGHLDAAVGAVEGGDLHLVKIAEQPVGVGGQGDQVDAVLNGSVAAGIRESGDNDGKGHLLGAGADQGDGQAGGIVGGDKPSEYFHMRDPHDLGVLKPIDWSCFGNRRVILHPDNQQREVA